MAAPLLSGQFLEVFPRHQSKYPHSAPIGRSGHCCAIDEAHLYVFGGYNPHEGPLMLADVGPAAAFFPSRQVMAELWKFNFATKRWTKMESEKVPKAAASSCVKLVRGKLFVYGGTVFPFGHIMSNTMSVCDIMSNFEWTTISPSSNIKDDPPQAYGQSIIYHDGSLFTFGGAVSFYSDPVSYLHKLDLQTNAWSKVEPNGEIPKGRYKQEVVTYNGKFYVFGGGHLSGAEALVNIGVYDFADNSWSSVKTFPDKNADQPGYPKPRSCFGCVQRDQHVIISGGRHYDTSWSCNEGLSDIWHLDLITANWRLLDMRLPQPTYFHCATLSPSGVMYIYGGIVDTDQRTSRLFKVQLFPSSLAEMCWQRFTDMVPQLPGIGSEKLLQLGVPSAFVRRIQF